MLKSSELNKSNDFTTLLTMLNLHIQVDVRISSVRQRFEIGSSKVISQILNGPIWDFEIVKLCCENLDGFHLRIVGCDSKCKFALWVYFVLNTLTPGLKYQYRHTASIPSPKQEGWLHSCPVGKSLQLLVYSPHSESKPLGPWASIVLSFSKFYNENY